jgi:short-subunit dehydrogenase
VKLKPLAQQVIVITGATSGIGLCTARMAAERGARVFLIARTEESLQKLTVELTSNSSQAAYFVADVADPLQVKAACASAIEHFGGFDTWVNNAAISIYGKFEDVPLADQRRLFETNYWGVIHGSLAAAEHLKDRGGAIINMGSALSDRAIPIQGTYCASKHAVKGFTDAFRMELEHDGAPISVTLIKPASIDTPYRQHAKNYLANEPKNPAPVYAPDTVAEAILYAAENPVRDLFVGGAGKALSAAAFIAPRLLDKAMKWLMFRSQQEDYPSAAPHNGLDLPSGSLLERGGYNGHVAKTSPYTQIIKRPFLSAGVLVAGLGLAYAAMRGLQGDTPDDGSAH